MNAAPTYSIRNDMALKARVDRLQEAMLANERARIAKGIPHPWGVSDEAAIKGCAIWSWLHVCWMAPEEIKSLHSMFKRFGI